MTLAEVRRWASKRGLTKSEFKTAYRGALLHAISRLLQAVYRESGAARLTQDACGNAYLEIGTVPVVTVPVSGPLPFRRIEATAFPWTTRLGERRELRSTRTFIRALNRCLEHSEYADVFDALSADFENSVTNVTLNRLIGGLLDSTSAAIEPAYQGHQYYPLPALRIGPSLEQILTCSHLSTTPVALPLLELDGCRVVTAAFDSPQELARAWTGLSVEARVGTLLPVHPWHLKLSPLVQVLVKQGWAALRAETIDAIPLASQRTCRVLQTGFDVKMPVNATLTGEHRLLYVMNCQNAPVISVLAQRFAREDGSGILAFQPDIASVFHDVPEFAPHVSAIIRAPVIPKPGEKIVPAINLWTGHKEARKLLASATSDRLRQFFDRYCRALMTGPVRFCVQWGMAFEPHLQNVYIAMRDGLPCAIVLRDLDSTILDPVRIQPVLKELQGEVATDTWRYMPDFELGGRRLVQAMLFGHLGEVISCLTEDNRVTTAELMAIVEDTWSDLEAAGGSAGVRANVIKMRSWSDDVKATLRTRLHRGSTLEFVGRQT